MGFKGSVLPEPLLKNQNVNCLTNKTPKNHTKTIFASSKQLLCIYLATRDWKEASKFFNLFLINCGEGDPSKFQSVHMTDLPKVEEMLQLNILLYDLDFVDGDVIGELARRSIQTFEKSVKLLGYNNHTCYVSDISSFSKSFRCSKCDTIFSTTGNLERHLITCSERVKHTYPKNVYQLRETL